MVVMLTMLMMLTFKIMMILTMLAMFSIAQHVLLQLAVITHDKTDREKKKNYGMLACVWLARSKL